MTIALSILRDTFGYRAFRGQQAKIIDHVAGGGNALVLLPTGGGKSLCYQIPALMRHGTAIVVSPLISLMQDQVAALTKRGVCAAALNSSLSAKSQIIVERNFARGDYDLLYVSPERLLTPEFLRLLDKAAARHELALFAIDEAHCISLWGHDFRPDYLRLTLLAEQFPSVPRIALTATADATTCAEIIKHLRLDNGLVFTTSFDRPNIHYEIVKKTSVANQLLTFLRTRHEGHAGIVYCLTRKSVEKAAALLVANGIRALPYHGEMSAAERSRNQEAFLRESGVVIVATTAFGMGIDKPDVRFVAHIDLPSSIESYYQETGRAGRDGRSADAWMAYGNGDVGNQAWMIYSSTTDEHRQRVMADKLDALLGLCEMPTCRRVRLLAYFGQESEPCGNCDTCLVSPQTWDATVPVRQALRCIDRTSNRYAAAYVIRLLMGESSDRAVDLRHDELAEFGIGANRSVEEWRGIIRQMMALGLLVLSHPHRALCLTDSGRAVLKGTRRVALRLLPMVPRPASKPPKIAAAAAPDDDALLKRLLEWRRDEARARHCLPDEIISRPALAQLARQRPQTLAALSRIAGIGPVTLPAQRRQLLELVARPEGQSCGGTEQRQGPDSNCRRGSGIGDAPLQHPVPEDQVIPYGGGWLVI